MQLELCQIQSVTMGASFVTHEKDGYHFYRFLPHELDLWKRNEDAFGRALCTAGIALNFITDSTCLDLAVQTEYCRCRYYFAFDILINGVKIETITNYQERTFPDGNTDRELPLGRFEKHIDLGAGKKEVRICFPWSVKAVVQSVTLDDGATVIPVKRKRKLLAFGDSITQGYDALSPSGTYLSLLANALDAEAYNKAIGGMVFVPSLVEKKVDFEPDDIVVAYGTNDWNILTKDQFIRNCTDFFRNLYGNYPNSRILTITPIWRRECGEARALGRFERMEILIREIAEKYPNVTVVSGFHLVDHDTRYFADLRLHPNDAGFRQYYENLRNVIQRNDR